MMSVSLEIHDFTNPVSRSEQSEIYDSLLNKLMGTLNDSQPWARSVSARPGYLCNRPISIMTEI